MKIEQELKLLISSNKNKDQRNDGSVKYNERNDNIKDNEQIRYFENNQTQLIA